MTYGYARVSSVKQKKFGNSLEDQRNTLEQYGCDEIVEEQYTGKTTNRPKFSELLSRMQSGDKLVVTKLDRFARTTVEGIETVRGLLERGVSVHILNMGLVDDSPVGRLVFTVLMAFAEYERDMIAERTAMGKELARVAGTLVEGRPRKDVDEDVAMFYSYQQTGEMTVEQICTELHISKSTWYNRVRELKCDCA